MDLLKTNDIWKLDDLDSPCVKLCIIHPVEQLCSGCYRSLDEIRRWSQMSNNERATIIADLPGRTAYPQNRRGGRKSLLNKK